ncbi:MAG: cytochrome o ubiquinol oxidase subunit III [Verrucomicrobia bacterium]|nr:cytochrome o ubiquinol oxidase subunit III [Verrucomicrobiota bacterium]MBS0646649.1 cytochrome o ubiquinol oxidase subunit III [Verrucomicrobiota bacterium]
MTQTVSTAVPYPDPYQDAYSKATVGFWTYLMTDCILFSALFATYAVLHTSSFGGPTSQQLYDLPFALSETMVLLVSSFTSGLSMITAHRGQKKATLALLLLTFLLGASFLSLELTEFTHLVREGNSWEKSAFLSSYFTLVGTHGFHITCGLFWMATMIGQVLFKGLTIHTFRRLTCLNLFWHFLDVIWIFIFTVVYLMGVI